MKINQIVQETTTSGSVAPVEHGFVKMETRNPGVYGGTKAGSLFKGKKTKAPYANSINEGAMKQLSMDLKAGADGLSDQEFQKKYKMTKQEARQELTANRKENKKSQPVSEAQLEEDDIILVPGQGRSRKNGFVPHGKSRVDHEVEMARSDLFSAAKNAQQVYSMIKDVSEDEGLDGWVQEKIIKANDYLNTIREYLEGKQVQGMAEQTIYEGMPADNDMGATPSGAKMTLGQWKQMWMKKMPNADFAAMFRSPPSMPGSAIAYFDGWMNNPDARWDPQRGVSEGSQRVDSLVTDSLKIMRGPEVNDAVLALKTVLGNREYNDRRGHYNFYIKQMLDMYGQQGVAEGYQLDEGAIETITALVKKIPGIGKYYQMAQQYKPQLIEILKTSKSGKEVKQKMEQLAAGQSATVAESGMMKQLGGLAVGGGSILSTMWMNAMGLIDGVLAHAAAGEVGGAVASGSILGLIPVTLMLFAAMLMFKGSNQSSDEKAQAFQAQRRGQGVAEGAKVDRMVKHVAQSEKKLGHSKKEAENIAWATANKRGMLDNKNKKAK